MSLENIYYIGQTVAVIAIVVSLFLLILQGRQTQKQIVQANTIAEVQLSKSSVEYFLGLQVGYRKTPEDNAFMDKALFTMDPLSDYEQNLLLVRLNSMFSIAVIGYDLRQKGMMSQETYTGGTAVMVSLLAWPRPRKYWNVFQAIAVLNPDFIEEFDLQIKQAKSLPKITPLELFDLNNALPEDMPVNEDELVS